METWEQRLRRQTREAAEAIERALATAGDAQALRAAMEEAAREPMFSALLARWGPTLYQRDRILFRPFILAHFPSFTVDLQGKPLNPWKGPDAGAFQAWLDEADARGDVELFRKLYGLKLELQPWKKRVASWRQELLDRLRRAATRSERQGVLARFELPEWLNEDTALELHRLDPAASREFIRRHLPERWDRAEPLWERFIAQARAEGDDALAFEVYRRLVDRKRWRTDALELAGRLTRADELVAALEQRHPDRYTENVAEVFLELAQRRGRDVMPYLLRRMHDVRRGWAIFGAGGYAGLLALARERGWLDLWSALLRGPADAAAYNREIRDLIRGRLPEAEVRRRLLLLAGVGRELNFPGFGLAHVKPLTDDVAVELYARFPELVRGPLRAHVAPGWHASYPKLTDRALAAGDEELVDYLASRVILYDLRHAPAGLKQLVEVLHAHYEPLLARPADFARRAGSALGRMPAYAVWNYGSLVARNALARLFFERAHEVYLTDPRTVRDLLESPQIHVQALAFRVLGADRPAACAQAVANLDLLQAALLRPLHRKTRLMAFAALRNAISEETAARALLARCRDAFDLPDQRYPKEPLLGLIAEILHRHPALRGERERPRVFRSAPP